MKNNEEIIYRIQNAIFRGRDLPRNSYNMRNIESLLSFSAYIAVLVLKFGNVSERDSVVRCESIINEYVHNDCLKKYLLNNLDETWSIYISFFAGKYSLNELSDFVLEFDSTSMFGRDAAEHTTPDSISKLALAILDPQDGETLADLGCGEGGFLVEAARKHNSLAFYGIDSNERAACLAAMKLDLLGVDAEVVLGDMFDAKQQGRFDKIFINYPFGIRTSHLAGNGEYYDAIRTGKSAIGRPLSADWFFNKLAFDFLSEGGTAVALMTNGAAFNGNDMKARQYFVDNGMIKAVVALPGNLFRNTTVSTVLIILGKNSGPIRMVDATDLSTSGRRWDSIGDEEVSEILYRLSADGDNSKLVHRAELAAMEFNLFPIRYLGRTINLINPVPLGNLALRIERGLGLSASELDKITTEEDTGISYLRLADIVDGCFSSNLPNITQLEDKFPGQQLHTGDLIISKNGAPFKIAVAEVPEGQTIYANGNLYIIRLDTSRVNPHFVAAYLASEDGKELMERMVVGTSLPNLPLKNLRDLLVPVPDMDVQEAVACQYQACLDEIEVNKIKLEKARIGVKSAYNEVMWH